MSENTKPFIVRTCVLTVAQYLRLGYASADAKLYRWAEGLVEADWTVGDEFPEHFHRCEGRSSPQALAGLEVSDGDCVMLFTDGCWSAKEAEAIREWMGALPDDLVRLVKVGSDADPKLTGNSVFKPDEILASVCGWLPEAVR